MRQKKPDSRAYNLDLAEPEKNLAADDDTVKTLLDYLQKKTAQIPEHHKHLYQTVRSMIREGLSVDESKEPLVALLIERIARNTVFLNKTDEAMIVYNRTDRYKRYSALETLRLKQEAMHSKLIQTLHNVRCAIRAKKTKKAFQDYAKAIFDEKENCNPKD